MVTEIQSYPAFLIWHFQPTFTTKVTKSNLNKTFIHLVVCLTTGPKRARQNITFLNYYNNDLWQH